MVTPFSEQSLFLEPKPAINMLKCSGEWAICVEVLQFHLLDEKTAPS